MKIVTEISALIDQNEILSLDIFDTAVLRAIPYPTDIFPIINARFTTENNYPLERYPQIRIESEKKARTEVWNQYGRVEITLDEIYHILARDHLIDEKIADLLKKFEIEIELALAQPNSILKDCYQYALEHGKRIFFTSDMYLPETVIHKILQNCGYHAYDHLLVSSTLGKTKSTGSLYEHLINTAHCNPNNILHIGDNIKSDIRVAQRYGLQTYHYEKHLDKALRLSSLEKQHIKSLKKRNLDIRTSLYLGALLHQSQRTEPTNNAFLEKQEFDFWYQFGYRVVGLLFLAFGKWLINRVIADKVDQLYFLSRDGFIIKKIYEILKKYIPEAPPAEYLYASRRALNIPCMTELDSDTMDFLVSGTSRLSVAQFIARLGLNVTNFEADIQTIGFSNSQHQVITGRDYALLRDLYHRIFPAIQELALKERQDLTAYLDSLGFWKPGMTGIVDIGWHGTLQRSISKLTDIEGRTTHIKGYYLGTFEKARYLVNEGHDITAYLCHLGQPELLHKTIKRCVEIFEFIHTAPHGSVIRFERTPNQSIQPVFDRADYDSIRAAQADALQKGAIDFVTDSAGVWNTLDPITLPPEIAIAPLSQVLSNPTPQQATYLGNLEHAEGFGDVYIKRYLAKPMNRIDIFKNPLNILSDYRSAFWRRGYIKRLFSI
jgi:predicted HAD superfamily hydrolase